MNQLEMVEKLREKTNASYEVAKAALEQADWDMLDAIVILEKQGRANSDSAYEYSTRENRTEAHSTKKEEKFPEVNAFMKQIGDWIVAGQNHFLEVLLHHELLLRIPLLFLILVLVVFRHFIPLLLGIVLVSLFFGVRYRYIVQGGSKDTSEEDRPDDE